jgi:hypothetical protein
VFDVVDLLARVPGRGLSEPRDGLAEEELGFLAVGPRVVELLGNGSALSSSPELPESTYLTQA